MRWRLMDGVPEEEVRRLLSIARRRRFSRNEVVFHREDPGDSLHLISKGRFAIRRVTRSRLCTPRVLPLCEQVCGSLQQQLQTLALSSAARSRRSRRDRGDAAAGAAVDHQDMGNNLVQEVFVTVR